MLTQGCGTAFEAKNLCDTQQQLGATSGLNHLTALGAIHTHGFLAKHRFAAFNRQRDVVHVRAVGSSDNNSVDFSRWAKVAGRIERVRNVVLSGGRLCPSYIAA